MTMVGIARLRYRPHTTLTAAWWADLQTKGAEYVERYDRLAGTASTREQQAPLVAVNR